jgi:hypothetical protein
MWAALLRRKTSLLLVFLALALSQACLSHGCRPGTAEPAATTVLSADAAADVAPAEAAVHADRDPHDSPTPSKRPHFSHWSMARVAQAESNSPDPLDSTTAVAAPSVGSERPSVRDGATPALLTAHTPAALQVFRS